MSARKARRRLHGGKLGGLDVAIMQKADPKIIYLPANVKGFAMLGGIPPPQTIPEYKTDTVSTDLRACLISGSPKFGSYCTGCRSFLFKDRH